jgi:hypothetical protein
MTTRPTLTMSVRLLVCLLAFANAGSIDKVQDGHKKRLIPGRPAWVARLPLPLRESSATGLVDAARGRVMTTENVGKVVDATLAGLGLAATLGLLGGVLEPRLGLKVFCSHSARLATTHRSSLRLAALPCSSSCRR